MSNVLKTRVINIGNSRGVRLPKPLLAAAGIDSEVEISIEEGSLVIRPTHLPRQGWEEQFKLMAARGEDKLPGWDAYVSTAFDEEEWEW